MSHPAPTAAQKRYWTRIAAMGCICCERPAEIAHAHSGSILEKGVELGRDYTKAKGWKLPYMNWLVLPICPEHGRNPYPEALDSNVEAWEEKWGTQVYWIDEMIRRTGLNVWDLARSRHDWAKAA